MEEVTSKKSCKCDVCHKMFISKSKLDIHKRIHSGEKPFECDICRRKFSQSGHLKDHYRIHTEEKTFKCEICKKSFSHKSALVRHKRVHTGEKPFECDICGNSYTRSSNLNRHKKKCIGQSASQQNETGSTSEIQFVDCGETINQEIKEESEVEDEINPLNFMISELCEDIDGDENIEIKQEIDDSTESGDLSLESAHEAESIELCNEVTSSEVSVATHSYLHTQHIDPSLNFVDCGEEIKKEIKEESLEVNETSEFDSLNSLL